MTTFDRDHRAAPAPDMIRRAMLTGAAGAAVAAGALSSRAHAQPASGEALSVRAFGAAGDGETDDTRAIAGAIDALTENGGSLYFPPGVYRVRDLRFAGRGRYHGVPGASILSLRAGGRYLAAVDGVSDVMFSGLTFDGNGRAPHDNDALVRVARGAERVTFDNCTIRDCANHGLLIDESACRVSNSLLEGIGDFAIKAETAEPVQITGNTIRDIGNNGIRVQRPEPGGPSQTIIANNVIRDVHAVDGGRGPYGNAISVYRAHNVIVQGNHITDCAFSAVRSNAGHGCQVIGNHCARHGDTVVWIEFGASGAVVMGNTIEDAGGSGVTITNFNRGGRMATCLGNVIVNVGEHGIKVEADIVVQGNNIDGAPYGIVAGQGRYLRNIVIDGNLIQDTREAPALQYGILISNSAEAGPTFVTNNRVFNAAVKAISGHDRLTPAPFGPNLYIQGNHPGIASIDLPERAIGGSMNYEPDTGVHKRYVADGWRPGWREM